MKVEVWVFEDDEGQVKNCLPGPMNPEFTLCGVAFNCNLESEGIRQISMETAYVTCTDCKLIISTCKKVKNSSLK